MSKDSFSVHSSLDVDGKAYDYFSLPALAKTGVGPVESLPFSLKVLLENLLRYEDGVKVSKGDVEAMVNWDPKAAPDKEIAFTVSRVLLQDFTGVPAVVDLAAMRDALKELGGDPEKINPTQPVDLVIDHSVQVDQFGTEAAFLLNVEKEYERNVERYEFLRWGQKAFDNFRVVPPGTGICHQVNVEYLAGSVMTREENGGTIAYPDTLVGTDSHTTMVNALGVLGWGVGGIEAEAAMLGQPISMLIPQVVGFELAGRLPAGATATDLVLTVTNILRKHGVVGKIVEFFGDGLDDLPVADRSTISNMSPEFGSTAAIFPIDDRTLEYLHLTGRSEQQIKLVEAYCRAQGMFRQTGDSPARYTDVIRLDLSTIVPSLAGPKRPQDRIELSKSRDAWKKTLGEFVADKEDHSKKVAVQNGSSFEIGHGNVVIAAITSCTNTSNPSVMVAAGLVARKAREKGLTRKAWVKTSLAPGSKVVTDYLDEAGLTEDLNALGFNLVGYGCTTCIGNSGPLPGPISEAINKNNLVATSVLSGNRNFEGRISPDVKANYLASPPLVVAYALAGTMDVDLQSDPLGEDGDGRPVYLKDIWPTPEEVQETIRKSVRSEMFSNQYSNVFEGDDRWRELPAGEGQIYSWNPSSTYVRLPPFFEGMGMNAEGVTDIENARVVAVLGDSVTTDHISPAGSIAKNSPAAEYLKKNGVDPKDFNSYGSRRGNHEVMMRGTFANIRIRNRMVPGVEGGYTRHLPDGEQLAIYDAAMKYGTEGVPLVVFAGKEYGSGSSRDWAAKGTRLLGIRAVIAESFERIHRSNLVGMGVLPLQFSDGDSVDKLELTGEEVVTVRGLKDGIEPRMTVTVEAKSEGGSGKTFEALVRIDTPNEVEYYANGGILQFVLRQLARN